MRAQQLSIDIIANNLANVNTAGFRVRKHNSGPLLQNIYLGDSLPLSIETVPKTVSTDRSFRQGNLEPTGDPKCSHRTWLFVVGSDGGESYTRDGSFRLDGQGYLVTSSGYRVLSETGVIDLPDGARDIAITEGGFVTGMVNGEHRVFAQLKVCVFRNSAGLETTGANLFRETPQSGEPMSPDGGATLVVGGYLETSNVEVVSEMVNLIVAQRHSNLIKDNRNGRPDVGYCQ